MSFLPYPTYNVIIRNFSMNPSAGRNGQTIFNTSDGKYYTWLGGQWNVINILIAPVSILRGQPIGLMGVTYANDVN